MVSSEPLYKISWLINEQINIKLKEIEPVNIVLSKRQISQTFQRFAFINETETYYLVSNKSQNGVLIEEQKQVDFWLKADSFNSIDSESLTKKIKTIKGINLAFVVDPGSLKSKQKLIAFDSEFDDN